MKSDVAALGGRLGAGISAAESRLIKWMAGIALTLAGILAAAGPPSSPPSRALG